MTERRRSERKTAAEITQFILNQNKLNEKIELALFGNENENGLVNDVKEMKSVFDSVGGAKKVTTTLLKGIILIGAAITAFYYVVDFIKKFVRE